MRELQKNGSYTDCNKDCFIDSIFPAYPTIKGIVDFQSQKGVFLRVQSPKALYYASAYFYLPNETIRGLRDYKIFPGSWMKVRQFRGKNYKYIDEIECKALPLKPTELEPNYDLQDENDKRVLEMEKACVSLKNKFKDLPFELNGKGKLAISVLKVGQGDLVLLRFPSGRGMIIDAHFTHKIRNRVYDKINLFFSNSKPEALLITHKHLDHLRRADELVKECKISQCWWGACTEHPHSGSSVIRVMEGIRQIQGTEIMTISESIDYMDRGFRLRLLHPTSGSCNHSDNPNSHSIVIDISWKGKRIILGGDLDDIGWRNQYNDYVDFPPKIDFMKVPHHCSRDGLQINMIPNSHITTSATSCGDDKRYKHPHCEPLNTYCHGSHHITRAIRNGGPCCSIDYEIDVCGNVTSNNCGRIFHGSGCKKFECYENCDKRCMVLPLSRLVLE